MTSDRSSLLQVRVIAVVFSDDEEARQTLGSAMACDARACCCGIVDADAGRNLADWWEQKFDSPLLIFRSEAAARFAMALEVLDLQPPGPLAVLTHRPEQSRRLLSWPREFQQFLTIARKSRPDVQIHVYEPRWSISPPRIV